MHIPESNNAHSVSCEDCEQPISIEDAMEIDAGAIENNTACFTCGKHVCNMCAVQAHVRSCLGCATMGT